MNVFVKISSSKISNLYIQKVLAHEICQRKFGRAKDWLKEAIKPALRIVSEYNKVC